MKVTVTSIVVDALGTISKGLVEELADLETRRQVEINQTALLRSVKMLKRVWEI